MGHEQEKELAALEAVKWIKDGMIVGLGSGSTATYMISALGDLVAQGLSIAGIPSSDATALLAKEVGIPLTSLDQITELDITIDGADEFDPSFRLIKGGGGALLREKIIAHNSKTNLIIADASKQVARLGQFKLPIEVVPFAFKQIMDELGRMDLHPLLRKRNHAIYFTDEGNHIVDVDISKCFDLEILENRLLHIPGIVETGLFLDSTDCIILGKGDAAITLNRTRP